MEKEKEKKQLTLKKKVAIILIAVILVIIVSFLIFLANDNKDNNNWLANKNVITIEELKNFLKQDEMGNYLYEDSVKLGPIIDFDYNNYDKLVSFSCIYNNNNNVTLNSGRFMIINKDTKEHKMIKEPTEMSAIIYYLNTENKNDKLKDIMELTVEYFKENGVDDFNLARENHLDKYVALGKDIGAIVGIKESRTVIDNALMSSLKYKNSNSGDASLLYARTEIFPRYMGVTITEQEYTWGKMGMPEDALNLLTRDELTSMKMIWGPAYETVTKYMVMDFANKKNIEVGKYSDKNIAKKELKLEEAKDEPVLDINGESSSGTENAQQSNLTSNDTDNYDEQKEDTPSTVQQGNTSSSNNNSSNDSSSSTGNKNNNDSSTTQQSGQTSSSNLDKNTTTTSNPNNNASDNDSNETYQPKQITTTLNIKFKDLINKNTTAQEIIKSENIYIRTEIKINGNTVDFDGKSYHGESEIPNTITKKYNATLTQDNPVAKVTVIIQIYDNSAGTETALYNEEITIDKTGTYEIK